MSDNIHELKPKQKKESHKWYDTAAGLIFVCFCIVVGLGLTIVPWALGIAEMFHMIFGGGNA